MYSSLISTQQRNLSDIHSDCIDTNTANTHKKHVLEAVKTSTLIPPELAAKVMEYYDFPKIKLGACFTAKVIHLNCFHYFCAGVSLYPNQFLIYRGKVSWILGYVDFTTGEEVFFSCRDEETFHVSAPAMHNGYCYTMEYWHPDYHFVVRAVQNKKGVFLAEKNLSDRSWVNKFIFGKRTFCAFDNLREEWVAASVEGHLVICQPLFANGRLFQHITRIRTGLQSRILFAKCLKKSKIVIVTKNTCEVWDIRTLKKDVGCEFLALNDKPFKDAYVMEHDQTLVLTTHAKTLFFLQLPTCTLLNKLSLDFNPVWMASVHPDHIWLAGGHTLVGLGGCGHQIENNRLTKQSEKLRLYTNGTQLIGMTSDLLHLLELPTTPMDAK